MGKEASAASASAINLDGLVIRMGLHTEHAYNMLWYFFQMNCPVGDTQRHQKKDKKLFDSCKYHFF